MSTRISAQVWDLEMPPTRKLVLISLADQANDEGWCWPSVNSLERRTGLANRSIQRAINTMISDGLLEREDRPGRSNKYRVVPPSQCHPRHSDTPSQCHPTPVTVSPHPRHSVTPTTLNRKGTVKESLKGARAKPVKIPDELPDGLSREVVAEFIEHRKVKKSKLTQYALELAIAEASGAAQIGMTPDEVFRQTIANGWAGVNLDWLAQRARRGGKAAAKPGKHSGVDAQDFGSGTADADLPEDLR